MLAADLNVLMARIIERKAAIKAEEEALRWDLDTLETLHADGVIDPKFSWEDWSFTRSAGRISYDYPPEIVALEIELQDRKAVAVELEQAVQKPSTPFWTIRAPKQ
jgi:hypothetical protein